jgi:hypothetical protein
MYDTIADSQQSQIDGNLTWYTTFSMPELLFNNNNVSRILVSPTGTTLSH